MTGAPVPAGADAIVMIELSAVPRQQDGATRVKLDAPRTVAGQNIMRRASSMAAGDVVLRAGAPLRAIELGVLAEVGRVEVRAIDRPTLAVLSTGNELVPAVRTPGPGQIRNSNGPLLVAAATSAGAGRPISARPSIERAALRAAIERGLTHDLLVISGGVSAGVLDLVPGVLAELGVEQVFHKVSLKPGKPLWFGVAGNARGTLVFGLPGNPVSSLVCFELFVRPAIGRLAGRDDASLVETTAPLDRRFHQSLGPRNVLSCAAVAGRWPPAGRTTPLARLRRSANAGRGQCAGLLPSRHTPVCGGADRARAAATGLRPEARVNRSGQIPPAPLRLQYGNRIDCSPAAAIRRRPALARRSLRRSAGGNQPLPRPARATCYSGRRCRLCH